jgi:hypothetical protein
MMLAGMSLLMILSKMVVSAISVPAMLHIGGTIRPSVLAAITDRLLDYEAAASVAASGHPPGRGLRGRLLAGHGVQPRLRLLCAFDARADRPEEGSLREPSCGS